MKVLSIVGARPQFIKAFVMSEALRESNEEILVHTGQHYDTELSDIFFEEMGLPRPDYHLGVGSSSHGNQTAEILAGIEALLFEEQPDLVLLYGDTNSTLAGAIAGSKVEVLMAHVEAGLRSYNRNMPEEINRVITDHVCDLHFAPSEHARENLAAEGITDDVYVTGDVMYDSVLWARRHAETHSTILDDLTTDEYILSTVHRPRNTDNPVRLKSIANSLMQAPSPVVLPLHPRTEKQLKEFGMYQQFAKEIHVIDPVGYLDFISLLNSADRVVTDSGGVQKEAFYLDTFCITLREETEWVETVDAGQNVLVGANQRRIEQAMQQPIASKRDRPEPYGDGTAAKRTAHIIERELTSLAGV